VFVQLQYIVEMNECHVLQQFLTPASLTSSQRLAIDGCTSTVPASRPHYSSSKSALKSARRHARLR